MAVVAPTAAALASTRFAQQPSQRLAARLDRLARRAHAFHRFAHHPLCDRYQSELIELRGRTRLCRGCACALGGVVAGLALGAVAPLAPWLGALVAATLLSSLPAAFQRASAAMLVTVLARPNKLLTRGLPLALTTWACASAAHHAGALLAAALRPRFVPLGALRAAEPLPHATSDALLQATNLPLQLAATLLGCAAWYALAKARYRARGPDRSPCSSCPERTASIPCSGWRRIVHAERAFARRAQQLMDREQHALSVNSAHSRGASS